MEPGGLGLAVELWPSGKFFALVSVQGEWNEELVTEVKRLSLTGPLVILRQGLSLGPVADLAVLDNKPQKPSNPHFPHPGITIMHPHT